MDVFTDGLLFWGGIILTLLIAVYLAATWNHGEFKKRGMAFSKPLPLVGNIGALIMRKQSPGEMSMEAYKKFQGHRAFGSFHFAKFTVVVRDPDVIRQITVKDFDNFTDHTHFFEENVDKLFGNSMINMRGDRWRAMRSTLSPAFTSSKMKSMYALIDKCGDQLADYLRNKSKDGLIHVEMKDLFTRYTNDVLATSAYGLHIDSLKEPENDFYKMGLRITDFGGLKALTFIGFLVFPKLMKLLGVKLTPLKLENFFCSIITDTMARREREHIIRPDMIQLLMEARKGTLKGDEGDDVPNKKLLDLSDDDIASQAFLFFIAGFETSATLLSFLSYQLAIHPEIQDKVREEIDEVLASHNGVLSYDAVQKMKYMDTVISETLRMWPPVAELDRYCQRDFIVPATDSSPAIIIKKGDTVHCPVYAIHHDPEHWPEPERFDPERFSDENKHNIKPYTYMPFGAGPRICIGNRFALMETKIAIANVLSKLILEVTDKTPIPIRLSKGSFNLTAEGGMWLGLKPRTNANQ